MVGCGKWSAIVSNIFRFFTRVAKSSEKKGNKKKKRNKTGTGQKTRKTSAEFPHFFIGPTVKRTRGNTC